METLFVLKNTVIVKNGGYDRIVYLSGREFERLEEATDQEGFISTLKAHQVWLATENTSI